MANPDRPSPPRNLPLTPTSLSHHQVLLTAGVFLLDKQLLRGRISEGDVEANGSSNNDEGSSNNLIRAIKERASKIQRLKHNVTRDDVINTIADLNEEELGRAVARAARVYKEPAQLMLATIQAVVSVTQVKLMSNCDK